MSSLLSKHRLVHGEQGYKSFDPNNRKSHNTITNAGFTSFRSQVSNAKQVSLILIATALFGTAVSLLNGIGIAIVLVGKFIGALKMRI